MFSNYLLTASTCSEVYSLPAELFSLDEFGCEFPFICEWSVWFVSWFKLDLLFELATLPKNSEIYNKKFQNVTSWQKITDKGERQTFFLWNVVIKCKTHVEKLDSHFFVTLQNIF